MTETTNDDKAQNSGSDKDGSPNKKFLCRWLSNFWGSLVDTVFSSVFLILGSLVVLACLDNALNLNQNITKIFNEAIGELTLLIVPFLLGIASAAYLVSSSCNKLSWAKVRLFNLMSGLQSLITSIVGLMVAKMLYFTHKLPHPSVLLIGIVSIVLVALFSTIEEEFKADEKIVIGGFAFFTLVIFGILTRTAV